jgi:hypothetical protein
LALLHACNGNQRIIGLEYGISGNQYIGSGIKECFGIIGSNAPVNLNQRIRIAIIQQSA